MHVVCSTGVRQIYLSAYTDKEQVLALHSMQPFDPLLPGRRRMSLTQARWVEVLTRAMENLVRALHALLDLVLSLWRRSRDATGG